jgi:hypothetical protein
MHSSSVSGFVVPGAAGAADAGDAAGAAGATGAAGAVGAAVLSGAGAAGAAVTPGAGAAGVAVTPGAGATGAAGATVLTGANVFSGFGAVWACAVGTAARTSTQAIAGKSHFQVLFMLPPFGYQKENAYGKYKKPEPASERPRNGNGTCYCFSFNPLKNTSSISPDSDESRVFSSHSIMNIAMPRTIANRR